MTTEAKAQLLHEHGKCICQYHRRFRKRIGGIGTAWKGYGREQKTWQQPDYALSMNALTPVPADCYYAMLWAIWGALTALRQPFQNWGHGTVHRNFRREIFERRMLVGAELVD